MRCVNKVIKNSGMHPRLLTFMNELECRIMSEFTQDNVVSSLQLMNCLLDMEAYGTSYIASSEL